MVLSATSPPNITQRISPCYCTSTTEQRSVPLTWLAAKERTERRHRPAVARAGLDENAERTLGVLIV
jgi:hypothetical protein